MDQSQGMPRGEMPGAATSSGTSESEMPGGGMTDAAAAPSTATEMPSGAMSGADAGNLASVGADGMPAGAMNGPAAYAGSAGVEVPGAIDLPGLWTLRLTPATRK